MQKRERHPSKLLRCNGKLLRLSKPQAGREIVVEFLDGDEAVAAHSEATNSGAPVRQLAVSREAVRACFEGTMIERAGAVARLSPLRFEAVFGSSSGDRRRQAEGSNAVACYQHGRDLLRIGRAITDAYVIGELAQQPIRVLLAAARAGRDPRAQLEAVAAFEADREARKGARE